MIHRLLINPGTPQSWEIQLKAGPNRIGRREENDHQIEHPSVSGAHCEIVVSDGSVHLKDLGSTNGTFVNRAPVQEILLQSGQHVQLGNVDMIFETVGQMEGDGAVAVGRSSVPLRLNLSRPQPVAEGRTALQEESPVTPRPSPPVQTVASAFCKGHPKTPARFFCQKCRKYFCDTCVMTQPAGGSTGKFCRSCGSVVEPVKVQFTRTVEKGFFARLPGAFAYPLRGTGIFAIIIGLLVLGGLKLSGVMLSLGSIRSMAFGAIMGISLGGYLFTYLQSILHSTEAEDLALPDLPGMSDFLEDVIQPFFRLLGLVMICFGPAILLAVWFAANRTPLPAILTLCALCAGLFCFPMAFLTVATLDTVAAANPLMVITSILKAPLEYICALLFLVLMFAIQAGGEYALRTIFPVGWSTDSMGALIGLVAGNAFMAFTSMYLLLVNVHVLGLIYVTKKEKLGWR